MMRLTLFALFFCFNLVLFGQKDISFGKSNSLDNEMHVAELVGSNSNGMFFLTENDQFQYNGIGFVTHNGDQFKSLTIKEQFPENFFALVVGNELHTFTTTQRENELQLVRKTYNTHLKLLNSSVFLRHTKVSARAIGHFKKAISPDGEKFAILQETPQEKGNTEILHCHVYELSGEKLWEKEFTTKILQGLKPVNEIEINNAGDAFVLKRIRKGTEFIFNLYNFYDKGNSVKAHTLDLKGPKITEIVMGTTSNNNLIVAGMYSNSTIDRSDGYFYAIYQPSGQQVLLSSKKIAEEEITKFKSGKKVSKKEAPLSNVYVQDIVATPDGFYLIFEPIVDIAHKIKGETTYDQEHIYGSLMAMLISNEGDLERFVHIPKNQNSWNDEGFFGSFYACTQGENVIIITSSFEADEKSRNNKFPFEKTIMASFSSNQKEDTLVNTLNMQGNLFSPLLVTSNNGELQFIATDKSRQMIVPGSID